jgi:Fur family peroxide stress response transcriptional regulator
MPPAKRVERLKKAGISPTVQRVAILKCLEESDDHPTADEVCARLRHDYPTIARATIYNTLDALTKTGTILRLTIDPNVSRYDADLEPHVHFRCHVCGMLLDLPGSPSNLLNGVGGHRVETVRVYAYGVCATCLAQEEFDGESDMPKRPKSSSADDSSSRGEAQ